MDENEELLDEPIEDAQLPGWLVRTHQTSGGRLYKSYTSPSGEIFRSRVTALAAFAGVQSGSEPLPRSLQLRLPKAPFAAAGQADHEPAGRDKIREALYRLANAAVMEGLSVSAVDGWDALRIARQSAERRKGHCRYDIIYCSPCGRRFRSLPEALRSLMADLASSPNESESLPSVPPGESEPRDVRAAVNSVARTTSAESAEL